MPSMNPTELELREADCWFAIDQVRNDEQTTIWKQRARLRQARWRAGQPCGFEPYAGEADERCKKGKCKPKRVGSRLELSHARTHKTNLLTEAAQTAARDRLLRTNREPFEMLYEDRLWADLLSSMPLCFNLFGDLAVDPIRAAAAVSAWWPDAPAGDVKVKFEHSPGRRNGAFLKNGTAFDVAFEIVQPDGKLAIVGVETKYHEHAKREAPPKEPALALYALLTEKSGIFASGWADALVGTDLQQIWLDHLLVLSMLRHEPRRWWWGRSVLVFPSENPSFKAAAERYAAVLKDTSTFQAMTLEELVDAPGAIPDDTVAAIRRRYL